MAASTSHPPSRLPFEDLPLLVLDLVCEHLVSLEPQRTSLFALSLVNKHFAAVTAKERFERISIVLENEEQFSRVLATWTDFFQRGGGERSRYVRRIKVKRHIQTTEGDLQRIDVDEDIDEPIDVDEDAFLRPRLSDFPDKRYLVILQEQESRDRLYQPLANFITACPALAHLIWASFDPVPSCILDALHEHLPRTRLHLHTWSLRYSPELPADELPADDNTVRLTENEARLLASPCLSSISVRDLGYDPYNHSELLAQGLFDLLGSLAPNLRSITWFSPRFPFQRVTVHADRPSRPGLYARERSGGVQRRDERQLTKVAVDDHQFALLKSLSMWANHEDYSHITTLEFPLCLEPDGFQNLVRLTRHGAFASLHSLTLISSAPTGDVVVALTQYLSALPPLSCFRLTGQLWSKHMVSSVQTSLSLHASSLRNLHLCVSFGHSSLQVLKAMCSNITSLHLHIERQPVFDDQLRMYETLGSFRSIQSLHLQLDCVIPDLFAPDPTNNHTCRKCEGERMLQVLATNAMDATRAQRIFLLILSANRLVRPGIAPCFRSLKLVPGWHHSCDCFNQMMRWVGRPWLCERKHADVHSDEVVVRELRARQRMQCLHLFERQAMREYCLAMDPTMTPTTFAWDRLWPAVRGLLGDEWEGVFKKIAIIQRVASSSESDYTPNLLDYQRLLAITRSLPTLD